MTTTRPPKPSFNGEWEWVTKDLAREYLEANHPQQRNRTPSDVAMWQQEMDMGRWVATHQGIAFDLHGYLVDGQTRLMALAGSKLEGLWMLVFREVPPQSQLVTDTGRSRSMAYRLKLLGVKVSGSDAGAVARFMLGGPARYLGTVSDGFLFEFINLHMSAILFAQKHASRSVGSAVFRAVIARAYYRVSQSKLIAFCDAAGDRLKADRVTDLDQRVRRYAVSLKGRNPSGEVARLEVYQRIQNLLRHYLDGEILSNVKVCERDLFPLEANQYPVFHAESADEPEAPKQKAKPKGRRTLFGEVLA